MRAAWLPNNRHPPHAQPLSLRVSPPAMVGFRPSINRPRPIQKSAPRQSNERGPSSRPPLASTRLLSAGTNWIVAARGRPPLPRGVLAFDAPEWQPPKVVLLDTNVVAEALLANQPEHSACLAVLERLDAEGHRHIQSSAGDRAVRGRLQPRATRAPPPQEPMPCAL